MPSTRRAHSHKGNRQRNSRNVERKQVIGKKIKLSSVQRECKDSERSCLVFALALSCNVALTCNAVGCGAVDENVALGLEFLKGHSCLLRADMGRQGRQLFEGKEKGNVQLSGAE